MSQEAAHRGELPFQLARRAAVDEWPEQVRPVLHAALSVQHGLENASFDVVTGLVKDAAAVAELGHGYVLRPMLYGLGADVGAFPGRHENVYAPYEELSNALNEAVEHPQRAADAALHLAQRIGVEMWNQATDAEDRIHGDIAKANAYMVWGLFTQLVTVPYVLGQAGTLGKTAERASVGGVATSELTTLEEETFGELSKAKRILSTDIEAVYSYERSRLRAEKELETMLQSIQATWDTQRKVLREIRANRPKAPTGKKPRGWGKQMKEQKKLVARVKTPLREQRRAARAITRNIADIQKNVERFSARVPEDIANLARVSATVCAIRITRKAAEQAGNKAAEHLMAPDSAPAIAPDQRQLDPAPTYGPRHPGVPAGDESIASSGSSRSGTLPGFVEEVALGMTVPPIFPVPSFVSADSADSATPAGALFPSDPVTTDTSSEALTRETFPTASDSESHGEVVTGSVHQAPSDEAAKQAGDRATPLAEQATTGTLLPPPSDPTADQALTGTVLSPQNVPTADQALTGTVLQPPSDPTADQALTGTVLSLQSDPTADQALTATLLPPQSDQTVTATLLPPQNDPTADEALTTSDQTVTGTVLPPQSGTTADQAVATTDQAVTGTQPQPQSGTTTDQTVTGTLLPTQNDPTADQAVDGPNVVLMPPAEPAPVVEPSAIDGPVSVDGMAAQVGQQEVSTDVTGVVLVSPPEPSMVTEPSLSPPQPDTGGEFHVTLDMANQLAGFSPEPPAFTPGVTDWLAPGAQSSALFADDAGSVDLAAAAQENAQGALYQVELAQGAAEHGDTGQMAYDLGQASDLAANAGDAAGVSSGADHSDGAPTESGGAAADAAVSTADRAVASVDGAQSLLDERSDANRTNDHIDFAGTSPQGFQDNYTVSFDRSAALIGTSSGYTVFDAGAASAAASGDLSTVYSTDLAATGPDIHFGVNMFAVDGLDAHASDGGSSASPDSYVGVDAGGGSIDVTSNQGDVTADGSSGGGWSAPSDSGSSLTAPSDSGGDSTPAPNYGSETIAEPPPVEPSPPPPPMPEGE